MGTGLPRVKDTEAEVLSLVWCRMAGHGGSLDTVSQDVNSSTSSPPDERAF